jgi:hypothetical protein
MQTSGSICQTNSSLLERVAAVPATAVTATAAAPRRKDRRSKGFSDMVGLLVCPAYRESAG